MREGTIMGEACTASSIMGGGGGGGLVPPLDLREGWEGVSEAVPYCGRHVPLC